MQAVKTVEFPFDTRLTLLATNTTLGTSTTHTFTAITVDLPESGKTIRAAWLQITHNLAASTTARRLDGMRVGVQVDAVAFNDGTDLTGTGQAQSGDPYSAIMDRDITSYLVTNYTGTSHSIGARVIFEHDIADNVNNVTCKLFITYEYADTSATQVKTVRIPIESLQGFLSTVANSDLRGSAAAGQIPALDTFLPEASKSYKHIWFEVHATDGGAAITNFNVNYSIDAGATAARTTLIQGLNGSSRFFDIWIQTGVMTTNAVHDFEAWSSLASRFERMGAVLHVTYTFDEATTLLTLKSLLVPMKRQFGAIQGTSAADRDVFVKEFWIPEEGAVIMRQSALLINWATSASTVNLSILAEGAGAAGGSQVTARVYNGTNFVQSGGRSLIHRIDLPHGGTALTLGRGRNELRLKIFASVAGLACGLSGYWIVNYESSKPAAGIGAENCTTQWMISDMYTAAIAGTGYREVATATQRTPIIPQSNYWVNSVVVHLEQLLAAVGWQSIKAEVLGSENGGIGDGWRDVLSQAMLNNAEFGWHTMTEGTVEDFKRHPLDVTSDGPLMVLTQARKYRINNSMAALTSMKLLLTTHSYTFNVTGTVKNSAGGTVTINLHDDETGQILSTTSRVGNGSYTIPWYDNTRKVFVSCQEGVDGTLISRSKSGYAG